MGQVTESIWDGSVIVPLADVQHIEPWPKNSVPGIMVITKHTRWDVEHDIWANGIWISDPDAVDFKSAWCRYRSELEADTLMDLSPAGDRKNCERYEKCEEGVAQCHCMDGVRPMPSPNQTET